MIIVSQDRKQIINFTNITSLTVSGNKLYSMHVNGLNNTLGKYRTEERAIEVLEEMQNRMFSEKKRNNEN